MMKIYEIAGRVMVIVLSMGGVCVMEILNFTEDDFSKIPECIMYI